MLQIGFVYPTLSKAYGRVKTATVVDKGNTVHWFGRGTSPANWSVKRSMLSGRYSEYASKSRGSKQESSVGFGPISSIGKHVSSSRKH